MDAQEKETPRRPRSPARFDVVVVGAGPYGLSAAAHLRGLGLNVAVFGKTLELWREHMPRGMLLRSQWWATNLSDPDRRYTFERFLRESARRPRYPFPREMFVEYAQWFQEHAVPGIDETYVRSIERSEGGFFLILEDGRRVESPAVVMAIGVRPYAHYPKEYTGLPPELVSHTCDLREPERFRGRRVVVVGGGQSAVECAALLHESGATVDLVSRHPIVWLEPDRSGERGILERIRAPDTGVGPGWKNWILEHAPFLFYRLPQSSKERVLVFYSGAWAADWLKARIADGVRLHEGRAVSSCALREGKLAVTLSDGTEILADHLLLATGYRVDIDRLSMMSPELRAAVDSNNGSPRLSRSFESSVPGLYFVGATAMRTHGPIFRFVLGCRSAAPRVARAVARRQRARFGAGARTRAEPESLDLQSPARGEESPPFRTGDEEPET